MVSGTALLWWWEMVTVCSHLCSHEAEIWAGSEARMQFQRPTSISLCLPAVPCAQRLLGFPKMHHLVGVQTFKTWVHGGHFKHKTIHENLNILQFLVTDQIPSPLFFFLASSFNLCSPCFFFLSLVLVLLFLLLSGFWREALYDTFPPASSVNASNYFSDRFLAYTPVSTATCQRTPGKSGTDGK